MNDSRIVFSTDTGRVEEKKQVAQAPKGDGIVRIRKETKGRKGKGMSVIEGLSLNDAELKTLCSELKKKCGCGGSVKGFNIEIQGDDREKIKSILEAKSYKVKLAGG
jgi:translation initiation factor 1